MCNRASVKKLGEFAGDAVGDLAEIRQLLFGQLACIEVLDLRGEIGVLLRVFGVIAEQREHLAGIRLQIFGQELDILVGEVLVVRQEVPQLLADVLLFAGECRLRGGGGGFRLLPEVEHGGLLGLGAVVQVHHQLHAALVPDADAGLRLAGGAFGRLLGILEIVAGVAVAHEAHIVDHAAVDGQIQPVGVVVLVAQVRVGVVDDIHRGGIEVGVFVAGLRLGDAGDGKAPLSVDGPGVADAVGSLIGRERLVGVDVGERHGLGVHIDVEHGLMAVVFRVVLGDVDLEVAGAVHADAGLRVAHRAGGGFLGVVGVIPGIAVAQAALGVHDLVVDGDIHAVGIIVRIAQVFVDIVHDVHRGRILVGILVPLIGLGDLQDLQREGAVDGPYLADAVFIRGKGHRGQRGRQRKDKEQRKRAFHSQKSSCIVIG